jgi:hypothetical protein
MKTLRNFLIKNKITMKHFCEINQFNYGSFRVMMIGKYKPSPELALKIEKATKGKVNRLELLYPNAKN